MNEINVAVFKIEAEFKTETEHFSLALQLLPCRPHCVDCSGIVWQGNKWFSVTEAFSTTGAFLHLPLFLSVAAVDSHMISINILAALLSFQKFEFVLC